MRTFPNTDSSVGNTVGPQSAAGGIQATTRGHAMKHDFGTHHTVSPGHGTEPAGGPARRRSETLRPRPSAGHGPVAGAGLHGMGGAPGQARPAGMAPAARGMGPAKRARPARRQERRAARPLISSGLYQLKCTHTIAFPVSSGGGEAQAMAAHRNAFPTPRGDGKSDPKGGVARLADVVARRLWCTHPKARRAPSRKPRNVVVGVQFS